MDKKIAVFSNKVVKQGNSLCVRLPEVIVHTIGVNEGDLIDLSISKVEEQKITYKVVEYLRNNVKGLGEFTDKELSEFAQEYGTENKVLNCLDGHKKKKNAQSILKLAMELKKSPEFMTRFSKFKAIINQNKNISSFLGEII